MTAVDADSPLVTSVIERVRERLPSDEAGPCERFVRQYYRWVPAEDLDGTSPLDLYGAALSLWHLAQRRTPARRTSPRLQPRLRTARLAVVAHRDRARL